MLVKDITIFLKSRVGGLLQPLLHRRDVGEDGGESRHPALRG